MELMNNILENTVEKISKQSWKKVKKYIIFSSQTCFSKFVLEAFLKLMCRLCCAFAALIRLFNSLRTTKPCSCTVLISRPDRGKGMLQLYFECPISPKFAPRWLSKHNFYQMAFVIIINHLHYGHMSNVKIKCSQYTGYHKL